MVGYIERQISAASVWARRFALFSFVLLITAGVGHRYGVLETSGFLPVLGVVLALAVVSLVLSGFGFARVWTYGDVGGARITAAVLVACIVLTPFAFAGFLAFTHPVLTDISTDLDDPPSLAAGQRARTPEMNPIVPYTVQSRKLQLDFYPEVTGRRYDMGFVRTVEAVERVMAAQGWSLAGGRPALLEGAGEVTVEAIAYTPALALPADVAVRITDEDATTYVDMRSAWRFGQHDLGDNARRIGAFLDALDAEISALAGTMPTDSAEPSEQDDGQPAEQDELNPPMPQPRPDN